jgi:hypothetical protein
MLPEKGGSKSLFNYFFLKKFKKVINNSTGYPLAPDILDFT